jgi:hypothetical protein
MHHKQQPDNTRDFVQCCHLANNSKNPTIWLLAYGIFSNIQNDVSLPIFKLGKCALALNKGKIRATFSESDSFNRDLFMIFFEF